MERTKRQLCTRFTDSLSSNHTDSLTLLNHATGCEVTAIALHADTLLRLTGEHRTDLHHLDVSLLDSIGDSLSDLLTGLDNNITGLWVHDVMY